jgi:regulator of protease activity HflC (stomatin/prohibitin superfamily)
VARHELRVAAGSSHCSFPATKQKEVTTMIRRIRIKPHERGLLFKEGALKAVLRPGVTWHFDPLLRLRLRIVKPRDPWLADEDIDLIARSGMLGGDAVVVDLTDHQRALVWINGRFARVLVPGLYVLWTAEHAVRVETVDALPMQLVHPEIQAIVRSASAAAAMDVVNVGAGHAAVWFRDGAIQGELGPGTYAFWMGVGALKVSHVDLKEQILDVSGQDIMTNDKVTLRLNALVTYRVVDPVRAVTEVDGAAQALYRSVQLALREAVGAKDLDALLSNKEWLAGELADRIRPRAAELGMTVVSAGIRDIILPGDMRELMNKVTEAKKAAEASLVTRREETAAMRMQANTAKILESSPTLMKLKELEVLEKVAGKANLTVVLGESGLTDRVVKLL